MAAVSLLSSVSLESAVVVSSVVASVVSGRDGARVSGAAVV